MEKCIYLTELVKYAKNTHLNTALNIKVMVSGKAAVVKLSPRVQPTFRQSHWNRLQYEAFNVKGMTKASEEAFCFWQHLAAKFLLHEAVKQVKKKAILQQVIYWPKVA